MLFTSMFFMSCVNIERGDLCGERTASLARGDVRLDAFLLVLRPFITQEKEFKRMFVDVDHLPLSRFNAIVGPKNKYMNRSSFLEQDERPLTREACGVLDDGFMVLVIRVRRCS